jgi:hypothetical protein
MKGMPLGQSNSNFALSLYYTFKIAPMIIGAIAIYLGYRLFILGVTGQASLSVDSHSIKGQLLNAAPGLFFAIGGIVANIVAVWKGVQIEFEKTGNVVPKAAGGGKPRERTVLRGPAI